MLLGQLIIDNVPELLKPYLMLVEGDEVQVSDST